MLTRLSEGIESLLRDNQCGFRKGRSCNDQLFTLRSIIDNALLHNLPLVLNFIDFKAAFDCVRRDHIWKTLEHYGFPQNYIRIFMLFYNNTMSAVRTNEGTTDWFLIKSGTGQGKVEAPPLFNIVLNLCLEKAITNKETAQGFMLQQRLSSRNPAFYITYACYADDIAALER